MRTLICAAASLGAVLLAVPAHAGEPPKPKPQRAASVELRAVPASYRGPTVGHGYTAQERRIADCLASFPNYDPKSDRIRVAPGVTRRCSL